MGYRSVARWQRGAALALVMALAGCGGGGSGVGSAPAPIAPTPTPSPTPSPAPSPTPTPAATFQTAEYTRSTGPAQHGAISAWQQGFNGQGVTIGIIDTGIDSDSPEFAGRLSPASRDVAGNRGVDGEDDHGTHVAMVAAAARDSIGVMGIAYSATIAMFRADSPGSCATETPDDPESGCNFFDSDIARGIDAAVAAGARVINLSLGGDPPAASVRDAVARAAAAGTVIVVSAGNDGDSTDPNVDPTTADPFGAGLRAAGNGNVIIAGSVDRNNLISDFSNRAGTEAQWYLTARGERVCCVYENGVLKTETSAGGTTVFVLNGTSFSAPQIAGAAALLFQAFPNLSAQQVVDLLLRTGRDAGTAGTDAIYGRGILDIAAAFAPQGATTLAGSTTAVTLGSTTGATSGAMGDAGSAGSLSAVVLDGYGRAYVQDFAAGLRTARLEAKLAPALAAEVRNVNLGDDAMALAFSVDASGRVARMPWQGQLRLSRADAEASRVLAARIVARLAPGTRLGVALRQGPDGLVAQLQGFRQGAFLIAGSPRDETGFARSGESSFALRHQLGRWGLTASLSQGAALTGAPVEFAADLPGRDAQARARRLGLALDRRIGGVETNLGLNWLAEARSVLGARFAPTLGQPGADSLFLDAGLGWQPDPAWRLGLALRGGQTWVRGSDGIAPTRLTTSAWSIDATRQGLFARDDSLALRVSQPLRVEVGSLGFVLPVAYDYATLQPTIAVRPLSLSPRGRELDAELAWRGTLWGGGASASLFHRTDPGHYADRADDTGLALRWVRQF